MKLTDIFKIKTVVAKEEAIDVEVVPVIIPLKEGQTYKDFVNEEFGGNVRAVKVEIEEHNKKCDDMYEILKKQGHLILNVKEIDRHGNERITNSWTPKAEKLFAPMRRKSELLKLRLEKEEALMFSKTFYLIKLAEKLDSLKFSRCGEEAYNNASRKIRELIPLMDIVNYYGFDIDEKTGWSINLSLQFESFVSTFESQKRATVDEEALKIEFLEVFERVKKEFNELNGIKEAQDIVDSI